MRLFAILLFVVVFTQTLLPCMDEHQHDAMHKDHVTQTSHQDSHHSETDCCSPFCTCQCCHTVFYVTEMMVTSTCVEQVVTFFDCPAQLENLELSDFLIPPKA